MKCRFKVDDLFFFKFITSDYWLIGKVTGFKYVNETKFIMFNVIRDSIIRHEYKNIINNTFSVNSPMYSCAKIIGDAKNETILALML